jgi:hypothetical protein
MMVALRNVLTICILLVAVSACGISKYLNAPGGNNAANTEKPAPTSEPVAAPSPTASPKPSPPGIFDTLKKSAGKYPYQLKLMENKEMQARLKKLLGPDYPAMKEHFDVQSPIEIVDGILMTTGCEAHNCGPNTYYLFIDFARNNINVFHVEDENTKDYFEKGRIKLPAKFAAGMGSDQ